MSPLVEEALDKFLNYPTTCPHGNPIPGSSFVAPTESWRLDQIEPGRTVRVERINEEAEHEPGLLAFLKEQGVVPGAIFHSKKGSPFKDIYLLIDVHNREVWLGVKTAHKIRVTCLPD